MAGLAKAIDVPSLIGWNQMPDMSCNLVYGTLPEVTCSACSASQTRQDNIEQLAVEDSDDDEEWMTEQDMLQYIDTLTVCWQCSFVTSKPTWVKLPRSRVLQAAEIGMRIPICSDCSTTCRDCGTAIVPTSVHSACFECTTKRFTPHTLFYTDQIAPLVA